jgi:malonyl-CoA decarboxylase
MNTTTDWLARRVAGFKVNKESNLPPAQSGKTLDAIYIDGSVAPQTADTKRSTRERLGAHTRLGQEGLSPRVLRRTLAELKAVVDPQVSEVEGGRRAQGIAGWYAKATPEQRYDAWLLMSEQFVADPQVVKTAQAAYAAAVGTPDEAAAEVLFRRATVSPRRRLLQRFSAFEGGIPFLVALRADMLPHLKADKRLRALDVEMEYMFSTWFDVGFLELERISWDSPASLLEKLIRYEAVHDIRSWADLKNRLDSDRRCYAFFHPRLPGEPLIFVEVALVDHMVGSITPLLDETAAPADLSRATTAIFYSISNTQTGLRGVSFGDSLIKRVVETLKQAFPHLKTFATLSPIPGLRAWLVRELPAVLDALPAARQLALAQALGMAEPGSAANPADAQPEAMPDAPAPAGRLLAPKCLLAAEQVFKTPLAPVVAALLLHLAARYLAREMKQGEPLDPVARFHLGNGARVERINLQADPSAKGIKQSLGLMVNYLYDLHKLDANRAQLARGRIATSRSVAALLR